MTVWNERAKRIILYAFFCWVTPTLGIPFLVFSIFFLKNVSLSSSFVKIIKYLVLPHYQWQKSPKLPVYHWFWRISFNRALDFFGRLPLQNVVFLDRCLLAIF
jgi:hypothetical protein